MSEWLESSLKKALIGFKKELEQTSMAPATRDIHVRAATRFAVFLLEDEIHPETVNTWKRYIDRRGAS